MTDERSWAEKWSNPTPHPHPHPYPNSPNCSQRSKKYLERFAHKYRKSKKSWSQKIDYVRALVLCRRPWETRALGTRSMSYVVTRACAQTQFHIVKKPQGESESSFQRSYAFRKELLAIMDVLSFRFFVLVGVFIGQSTLNAAYVSHLIRDMFRYYWTYSQNTPFFFFFFLLFVPSFLAFFIFEVLLPLHHHLIIIIYLVLLSLISFSSVLLFFP